MPQFVTVVVSPKYQLATEIPSQLNILSCRARPIEKTQLRCMDANCKLRPESERDAAFQAEQAGGEPDRELQPDDLDALGADAHAPETLEAEAEEACEEEVVVCPGGGRRCVVDLWPFAFNTAREKTLFEALGIA